MTFLENLRVSNKVYVIAEGADAHYGSLERAQEMAQAALRAGADAIKFQHHIPDAEMLRDVPRSANMREPLYDFLMKNALSLDQHRQLEKFCSKIGIVYLCTPFSWQAAKELLLYMNLPVVKIGSGEMNDLPTLDRLVQKKVPLIVSTGMAEVEEIDEVYEFLTRKGADFALLNCTSAYPPKFEDLHLKFISVMQDRYPKAIIGHSDHSPGISSSIAAIALGARIIEKHVTLDTNLIGPDSDVSITFEELRELVSAAHELPKALHGNKKIHSSEEEIRSWARRSLVYTRNLSVGHVVEENDIWGKRPGTGVPSKNYWRVLGRRLIKDVSIDSLLSWEDFEDSEQ